jgi:hypothetical protein
MRNILKMFVAALCLILFFGIAVQATAKEEKITKKDVPASVLSAFQKAYPNAKVKGYSTETENGKTTFEVESMQGKMTLDVEYLPDGTATEIEEGVAAKDLPSAVTDAVKAKYAKGKIAKAEKKTVGTVVTYELKVTAGKTHAGLEVDPSGKIIKESKGKAKKEEKEEKEKD